MSELPDFIPYASEFDPQLPPPYRFENVSSRIFLLNADKAKLQALCDKHINSVAAAAGETFVIKPIQSVVLMEILTHERMFSTFAGAENLGFCRQNELFLAIPVALYTGGPSTDKSVVSRVGLFVPFLFVDHDWSQVAGREIFGLQKLTGQFQLPQNSADAGPVEIKARVLDPYAPDSESKFKPIVQIDASESKLLPAPADRKVWPFGMIEDLFDSKNDRARFPVSREIASKLRDSAGMFVTSFSLRQFREGNDPTKASFRSIQPSTMKLESFGRAHFLPNTVCRFPGSSTNPYRGYRSLSLIDELGLVAINEEGDVKAERSFFYEGDFAFDIEPPLLTQCGSDICTRKPDLPCADLIRTGMKETSNLIKRQARVAKHIVDSAVAAETSPEKYFTELKTGFRNALGFSRTMCGLGKAGLDHVLPD